MLVVAERREVRGEEREKRGDRGKRDEGGETPIDVHVCIGARTGPAGPAMAGPFSAEVET